MQAAAHRSYGKPSPDKGVIRSCQFVMDTAMHLKRKPCILPKWQSAAGETRTSPLTSYFIFRFSNQNWPHWNAYREMSLSIPLQTGEARPSGGELRSSERERNGSLNATSSDKESTVRQVLVPSHSRIAQEAEEWHTVDAGWSGTAMGEEKCKHRRARQRQSAQGESGFPDCWV